MEAMTSSVPSSARAYLDKIILYAGPPCEKRGKPASIDAEEWPDIDEIFAQAARQEWASGIGELDLTVGFGWHG